MSISSRLELGGHSLQPLVIELHRNLNIVHKRLLTFMLVENEKKIIQQELSERNIYSHQLHYYHEDNADNGQKKSYVYYLSHHLFRREDHNGVYYEIGKRKDIYLSELIEKYDNRNHLAWANQVIGTIRLVEENNQYRLAIHHEGCVALTIRPFDMNKLNVLSIGERYLLKRIFDSAILEHNNYYFSTLKPAVITINHWAGIGKVVAHLYSYNPLLCYPSSIVSNGSKKTEMDKEHYRLAVLSREIDVNLNGSKATINTATAVIRASIHGMLEMEIKNKFIKVFNRRNVKSLLRMEKEFINGNKAKILNWRKVILEDSVALVGSYIKGQNHRSYINTINIDEAIKSVGDVLRSIYIQLQASHIVHRDLKPENIMLTPTGRVAIIDYDSSKTYDEKDVGVALGTNGYVPPEVKKGQGTSRLSDYYSLGVMFNDMFNGKFGYSSSIISYLSTENQAMINHCLDSWKNKNIENRCTLSYFIESISAVYIERRVAYYSDETLIDNLRNALISAKRLQDTLDVMCAICDVSVSGDDLFDAYVSLFEDAFFRFGECNHQDILVNELRRMLEIDDGCKIQNISELIVYVKSVIQSYTAFLSHLAEMLTDFDKLKTECLVIKENCIDQEGYIRQIVKMIDQGRQDINEKIIKAKSINYTFNNFLSQNRKLETFLSDYLDQLSVIKGIIMELSDAKKNVITIVPENIPESEHDYVTKLLNEIVDAKNGYFIPANKHFLVSVEGGSILSPRVAFISFEKAILYKTIEHQNAIYIIGNEIDVNTILPIFPHNRELNTMIKAYRIVGKLFDDLSCELKQSIVVDVVGPVDPLNLSSIHNQLLAYLMKNTEKHIYYKSGENHRLIRNDFELFVQFKRGIIWNKQGYDVIGETIGFGSYVRSANRSMGFLRYTNDGFLYEVNNARVIKFYGYKASSDAANKMIYQYTMSSRIPYLQISRPIFLPDDNVCVFIENELGRQEDVLEFIINECHAKERNNLYELLHIARAVAVNMIQLESVGIVHHDIKPDNIIIKKSKTYQSYIFDFNLSKFTRDKIHHFCGTKIYSPPEKIIPNLQTINNKFIDSYSFGICFMRLLSLTPIYQYDFLAFMSFIDHTVDAFIDSLKCKNFKLSTEIEQIANQVIVNYEFFDDPLSLMNALTACFNMIKAIYMKNEALINHELGYARSKYLAVFKDIAGNPGVERKALFQAARRTSPSTSFYEFEDYKDILNDCIVLARRLTACSPDERCSIQSVLASLDDLLFSCRIRSQAFENPMLVDMVSYTHRICNILAHKFLDFFACKIGHFPWAEQMNLTDKSSLLSCVYELRSLPNHPAVMKEILATLDMPILYEINFQSASELSEYIEKQFIQYLTMQSELTRFCVMLSAKRKYVSEFPNKFLHQLDDIDKEAKRLLSCSESDDALFGLDSIDKLISIQKTKFAFLQQAYSRLMLNLSLIKNDGTPLWSTLDETARRETVQKLFNHTASSIGENQGVLVASGRLKCGDNRI